MSEDEISTRLRKREDLLSSNIIPYPYTYSPTHTITEIVDLFNSRLEPGQSLEDNVRVAGRVMAIRSLGKRTFLDLEDTHGKVQISLEEDKLGPEAYQNVSLFFDRGDFIGVAGSILKTQRGELSVSAQELTLLTKSIRPLPTKSWLTEKNERRGGLVDPEIRYRQPELRLLTDPSSREVLAKRAKAITMMREILERHKYMEVEIPTLQPIYGGASARPFTTTLNAFSGMELYLSISPELYLKRLIVGGFYDGVYTICKNFRNEGIDRTHNPEFTMMECYKAFWDYNDLMRLTENMWAEIFERINGSTSVRYAMPNSPLKEQLLDFKTPWKRATMSDLINEHVGIDVTSLSEEALQTKVQEIYLHEKPYLQATEYNTLTWGAMVQKLFETYVEDKLIQPTFVIDHPRESTPLCKGHRGDKRLIERFEPFVYGVEIGNAYSELNDPVIQRQLLEEQAAQAARGVEGSHQMDEYFCRAIELGMPPTAGLGIGIDRLVMFLTGSPTIRDVIAFPFMKPETPTK